MFVLDRNKSITSIFQCLSLLICVSLVTQVSLDLAVTATLSCSPGLHDVDMLLGILV